ncbi:MAG: 5'-nucleotidase C-terminal domain-containing protein [bacterium]
MQINPNSPNIHTSILYLNDLHAQTPYMQQLKSEMDTFELNTKDKKDVDSFILAGGDSFIGHNKEKNKLVSSFLNISKVEYSAIGNHEVDSINTLEDNLCNTNTKFVVSNMKKSGNTPFDKYIDEGKIVSSTIAQKNGHKYGLIGAAPFKLNQSKNLHEANLDVEQYEKTKENIQLEVKKLQEQGVDKIIMLSHIGYAIDLQLAKEVNGIDVIVGGHSHDLVKGTKNDKNIITAPDGNPVVILQAGQNGEYIGKLDITFDETGKIIEATNNVKSTKDSPKNLVVKFFQERILGKSEQLGTITRVDKMEGDPKIFENPYADFFGDSMKNELNADIAFVNSASVRGKLEKGKLTSFDIDNLVPFENNLVKVEISEKQIINTLKDGALSVNDKMLKPGIMQVSGLSYTIDEKGQIKNVAFKDKKGNSIPLNNENPSDDKKFIAIADEFLINTSEYPTLKQTKILEKYDFGKEKVAKDYTKKLDSNNIEIKLDGRIQNKSHLE